MTGAEIPPLQQQQVQPETQQGLVAEHEALHRSAAEIAMNGIAVFIDNRLADIVEAWAERAEKKADKSLQKLEGDMQKHYFLNGAADPSDVAATGISRRKRRQTRRSLVKAQDAEWKRKEAENRELANGGLGRISRGDRRLLQRDMQDMGLRGEISPKEMALNRELIKLGGHVVIDGETRSISAAKPRLEVTRAYKRADRADARSLRTLDIQEREEAIAKKRRDAAELYRRADELRQRRQT